MIRLRRLLLGIDQRELARRLDISFQHLQGYEWGILRAPGSLLYALSEALSVPVNFFFEGLEGVVREKGVRPPKPLSPELQSVIDDHLSPNNDGRSLKEVMRLITAYWALAPDKRSKALATVKHAAWRGALPDNKWATDQDIGGVLTIVMPHHGDCIPSELLGHHGFGHAGRVSPRGTITTSTAGETRTAAEWVQSGRRARVLRGAEVTVDRYQLGTVVCVQDSEIKQAWYLAVSSIDASAKQLTGYTIAAGQ
jgi:transcriptional regulator with XRE-family HTH domain